MSRARALVAAIGETERAASADVLAAREWRRTGSPAEAVAAEARAEYHRDRAATLRATLDRLHAD